jgi:hypothetical protein
MAVVPPRPSGPLSAPVSGAAGAWSTVAALLPTTTEVPTPWLELGTLSPLGTGLEQATASQPSTTPTQYVLTVSRSWCLVSHLEIRRLMSVSFRVDPDIGAGPHWRRGDYQPAHR